jgi:beta-lactam-binding protein with PASTA domain
VTLKATAASLVAVPNVVGQEAGHADQILDADGFKGATPGIAATAKITSQHPAAGTKAARGSTVTLKAAPAKKK